MFTQITSLQNGRIKNVVKLNDRRHRDQAQQTVVEGVRESNHALQRGIIPLEAYICPVLLNGETAPYLLQTLHTLADTGQTAVFEVTPELFAKMAYRGESGGIILVIPYLAHRLATFPRQQPAFWVIIAGADKPGNLGAILRTADAAGVDGVIVASNGATSGTDIHNPNVIRASLGALFTLPVITATETEVITWLKQHHIRLIAATPAATNLYTAVSLTGSIAILLGSEAEGLSRSWLASADEQVVIPMSGKIDSLNLSAATAVLLYEAVRQRAL